MTKTGNFDAFFREKCLTENTCGLTIENFEAVTMATMAAWIGIPGGISYVYYQRKMSGKL